jgi:hypothetical protein
MEHFKASFIQAVVTAVQHFRGSSQTSVNRCVPQSLTAQSPMVPLQHPQERRRGKHGLCPDI